MVVVYSMGGTLYVRTFATLYDLWYRLDALKPGFSPFRACCNAPPARNRNIYHFSLRHATITYTER